MPDLEQCPGCRTAPGSPHGDGCDHAVCPDCGGQLLFHDCEIDGPERPAIWHGVNPQAEVARALNWWTTAVGIDHLVEDYTRVTIAEGLGQIAWDRDAQRYRTVRIDNAAIDHTIATTDRWGRPLS